VIYFDAAYIAKCYLNEPAAERVRELARNADGLGSCEVARLEVFATVHRHLRERHIKKAHLGTILDQFEGDERDGVWHWFPVTPRLLGAACDRLRALAPTVFVRAIDALHLMCAGEQGFSEVCTNDRHMIAAASHFRIKPRNVL
jgi:predicted nucleic acid-binding protein